jgi:hypothetical protein
LEEDAAIGQEHDAAAGGGDAVAGDGGDVELGVRRGAGGDETRDGREGGDALRGAVEAQEVVAFGPRRKIVQRGLSCLKLQSVESMPAW